MPEGSPYHGHVPPYHEIRIDSFTTPRVVNYEPAQLHLLSHTHSDHIGGLKPTSFGQPVICSPDAKEMLLNIESLRDRVAFDNGYKARRVQLYRHLCGEIQTSVDGSRPTIRRQLLRTIPLNTPTEIVMDSGESVTVTALDANHCPGSVMYLIEGSRGAILHTGDVRCEPPMIEALRNNPLVQAYLNPEELPSRRTASYSNGKGKAKEDNSSSRTLEAIYLDTACLLSKCEMPTKKYAVDGIIQMIAMYPPHYKFFINAWTWGYEEILLGVANAFNTKIHVDRYKHTIYNNLEQSDLASIVTSDQGATRFHACERHNRCEEVCEDVPDVVYVTPRDMGVTRWQAYHHETMSLLQSGHFPNVLHVALGRHSPLPELQSLVHLFRPKRVVPLTVYSALNGGDWAMIPGLFKDHMAPGATRRILEELISEKRAKLNVSDLDLDNLLSNDFEVIVQMLVTQFGLDPAVGAMLLWASEVDANDADDDEGLLEGKDMNKLMKGLFGGDGTVREAQKLGASTSNARSSELALDAGYSDTSDDEPSWKKDTGSGDSQEQEDHKVKEPVVHHSSEASYSRDWSIAIPKIDRPTTPIASHNGNHITLPLTPPSEEPPRQIVNRVNISDRKQQSDAGRKTRKSQSHTARPNTPSTVSAQDKLEVTNLPAPVTRIPEESSRSYPMSCKMTEDPPCQTKQLSSWTSTFGPTTKLNKTQMDALSSGPTGDHREKEGQLAVEKRHGPLKPQVTPSPEDVVALNLSGPSKLNSNQDLPPVIDQKSRKGEISRQYLFRKVVPSQPSLNSKSKPSRPGPSEVPAKDQSEFKLIGDDTTLREIRRRQEQKHDRIDEPEDFLANKRQKRDTISSDAPFVAQDKSTSIKHELLDSLPLSRTRSHRSMGSSSRSRSYALLFPEPVHLAHRKMLKEKETKLAQKLQATIPSLKPSVEYTQRLKERKVMEKVEKGTRRKEALVAQKQSYAEIKEAVRKLTKQKTELLISQEVESAWHTEPDPIPHGSPRSLERRRTEIISDIRKGRSSIVLACLESQTLQ